MRAMGNVSNITTYHPTHERKTIDKAIANTPPKKDSSSLLPDDEGCLRGAVAILESAKAIHQNTDIIHDINALEKVIRQLRDNKNYLSKINKINESRIYELEEENESLLQEINVIKHKHKQQLTAVKQQLVSYKHLDVANKGKLKVSENKIHCLNSRLTQNGVNINNLNDKVKGLTKENEELDKKSTELINAKEQLICVIKENQEEISLLKQNVAQQIKDNKVGEKKYNELNLLFQVKMNEIAELEKECNNFKVSLDREIESNAVELEKYSTISNRTINELKQNINAKNIEYNKQNEKYNKLNDEFNKLQKEFKNKMEQLTRNKNNLQQQFNKMEETVSKFQNEINNKEQQKQSEIEVLNFKIEVYKVKPTNILQTTFHSPFVFMRNQQENQYHKNCDYFHYLKNAFKMFIFVIFVYRFFVFLREHKLFARYFGGKKTLKK